MEDGLLPPIDVTTTKGIKVVITELTFSKQWVHLEGWTYHESFVTWLISVMQASGVEVVDRPQPKSYSLREDTTFGDSMFTVSIILANDIEVNDSTLDLIPNYRYRGDRRPASFYAEQDYFRVDQASDGPYQLVPECRMCYATFSGWDDLKAQFEGEPLRGNQSTRRPFKRRRKTNCLP